MLRSLFRRRKTAFDIGSSLLDQENWHEAASVLADAVAADPEHLDALRKLVVALLKSEQWEMAAEAARQAIDLDDSICELHTNLGIGLIKSEQWSDSASAFQAAVALDPGNIMAWENLSIALLKAERWGDACDSCRLGISNAAENYLLHNNLAIALLKREQWEEASLVLQSAIAINPTAPEPQRNLGAARMKLEDWAGAAEAYQHTLEKAPEDAQAQMNLAMCWLRLEKWGAAIEALEQALSTQQGEPRIYFLLGSALGREERWEEAATAYRRCSQAAPEDPHAHINLANALAKLRRFDEAQRFYNMAITRGGNDISVQLGLGDALAALERWEQALDAYQNAAQLSPDNPGLHLKQAAMFQKLSREVEAQAARQCAFELSGNTEHLGSEPQSIKVRKDPAHYWSPERLGADVFRVERWLKRLSQPKTGNRDNLAQRLRAPDSIEGHQPTDTRLMFVLDNDFGELTTIMYLALGQPLIERSTLLLTERLYAKNADALPGKARQYTDREDVLSAVDAEDPDIVFLCSGYLLATHRIFSLEELRHLVSALRARGCQVVTCDPFLGMLSKLSPPEIVKIDIPTDDAGGARSEKLLDQLAEQKAIQEEFLWENLTHSEEIFRQDYHLYPSFPWVSDDEFSPHDARNISFFNENLICPELGQSEDISAFEGMTKPHWLFVLSQTDYETQAIFETHGRFASLVAKRLTEAVDAGKHPILIAPDEFITLLINELPDSDDIDLISFCPFERMIALLLTAEHAFYWNVVSHSIMVRLFNQRPVVLFDRGHLVRNVNAMYSRVIDWYYQGIEPAFLDYREPLPMDELHLLNEKYAQVSETALERFRRAPSPNQMIEQIMAHNS